MNPNIKPFLPVKKEVKLDTAEEYIEADFKLFRENSQKDISAKKSNGVWKQCNVNVIK